MANINEIIKAAQSFGIKLANAELGTEFCLRWTDRVAVAKAQPFPRWRKPRAFFFGCEP